MVHLNTVNESVELDKQKLSDAHAQHVRDLKEEADANLALLKNEIHSKDKALRELTDRLVSTETASKQRLADVETEYHQRLVAVQAEASAEKAEQHSRHDEEIKALIEKHSTELSSQAEIARDLSTKLKESSAKLEESDKKHRAEVASIREQLKKEHQLAMNCTREELTNSHTDEMYLLKSQHEKVMARLKIDATEHEKIEVENAVASLRAEYEQKMYQQIVQHNEKCQMVKTEVTHRLNAEITDLQNELDDTRAVAQEVPSLRSKIHDYEDNALKLQSEVRRLQNSLDASTTSNQRVIDELKKDNEDLQSRIDVADRSLVDSNQQICRLEKQVSRCLIIVAITLFHCCSMYLILTLKSTQEQ